MNKIDIKDIRNYFPWFKNNPDYTYFDSAATSLKPQTVIDAITEYYEKYSTNPHNADSPLTFKVSQHIHETKELLAEFIHCDANEIAFTSGATESLNLVANGIRKFLKAGDEIILTYGEHASNILPWMKLRDEIGIKIVFAGKQHEVPTIEDFKNALSEKTKVVSFASGFNVTATTLNEKEITKVVKDYNPEIVVVVDATQSIAHRELFAHEDKYDFLVCSAHKMFGPTGIGLVYIKKDWVLKATPLRFGGGMNFSITEQEYFLLETIERFEGGTPHVAGIYGWYAAVKFFQSIGYKAIQEHEIKLANYAREKLSQLKNVVIYNLHEHSPNIAFNLEGVFSQDLASYLGQNKIIVRSGLSCAKLICHILDTYSLVRCSMFVYNTLEDIDRLFEVLKNFKKGDELDGLFN